MSRSESAPYLRPGIRPPRFGSCQGVARDRGQTRSARLRFNIPLFDTNIHLPLLLHVTVSTNTTMTYYFPRVNLGLDEQAENDIEKTTCRRRVDEWRRQTINDRFLSARRVRKKNTHHTYSTIIKAPCLKCVDIQLFAFPPLRQESSRARRRLSMAFCDPFIFCFASIARNSL